MTESGGQKTEDGVVVRAFAPRDADGVVALWRACGLTRPQNDPHKDIARKLKVNPDWFLVAVRDGEIVGTVMAGYEGHRGWINYLGVAPTLQRGGLGRRLMAEAETRLRAAGCPKINLQVRPDNRVAIAFYERIGFAVEGAVSLGKRLEHD